MGKNVTVTFWDWLWAWTRDDVVWDWLRPTLAALLGALVGGLFTLWGQRQSLGVQRQRDDDAWQRAQNAERHRSSREDARRLFEDFTNLAREIQDTPETWSQIMGTATWAPEWKKIWTLDRSLAIDVRARLIPDSDVRASLLELVQFLDDATKLSADPDSPAPGVRVSVRAIAQVAAGEAIDVLGGYLRGDQHAPVRTKSLETLRTARDQYNEWESYEIERSSAAAEADTGTET